MFIKSDDVVPQVLGQAVLDLEFGGKINRLNYYIQSVATTEKKHDSTFLTVILSFDRSRQWERNVYKAVIRQFITPPPSLNKGKEQVCTLPIPLISERNKSVQYIAPPLIRGRLGGVMFYSWIFEGVSLWDVMAGMLSVRVLLAGKWQEKSASLARPHCVICSLASMGNKTCFTIANPRPVPPVFDPRPLSTLKKRSVKRGMYLGRYPVQNLWLKKRRWIRSIPT